MEAVLGGYAWRLCWGLCMKVVNGGGDGSVKSVGDTLKMNLGMSDAL